MSTHASHQLLSNIEEQRRDKEAVALQHLTKYRQTLSNIIKQSSMQLSVLQEQREIKTSRGAQASELMLLEQSLFEHQMHINDVTSELAGLDLAIAQQKKKWVAAHKKFKAHDKLHQQLQRKAIAMLHQKTQRAQDDQFSASMMRQRKVSV